MHHENWRLDINRKAIFKDISFIIAVLALVRISSFGPTLRGLFPEPFDVFNHIGNMVPSIMIGRYMLKLPLWWLRRSGEVSPKRLNMLAGFSGVAVLVANLVVETEFGLSLVSSGTTPDLLDLIYGVVAGWVSVWVTWLDERSGGAERL